MQTIVTYPATSALPKKPPDSTTAHGVAAVALPHRHHLIIRLDVGPAPLQFVYSSIPGNRNWQIETADWNLDVRLDI